jgi:hypothetical protein
MATIERHNRFISMLEIDRFRSSSSTPDEIDPNNPRSISTVAINPNILIECDESSNVSIKIEPQSEFIASDKIVCGHLPTLLL